VDNKGAGRRLAPELVDRLATERNVWLVTLRPDGSPHLTPIWFVWADGAFWLCTSGGNAKARNLGRDPRVALSLEDGDRPVVAESEVRLHRRPYPAHIAAAFAAKFGWDISSGDQDGDFALLIEAPVRRWLLGGPR
jgi:PPOX class probable F420-dependent enzyme